MAQYVHAIAEDLNVLTATEDDPRWAQFDEETSDFLRNADEKHSLWDSDDEDFPTQRSDRSSKPAGPLTNLVDWNSTIEEHLRAKSQQELTDLV